MQYSLINDHQRHKKCSNNNEYHTKITRMRRISGWRSIKFIWEMFRNCSKIRVLEHTNIWTRTSRNRPVWKPKSFSFDHNVYGHLLEALLREQNFDKFLLKYEWEKLQLRMLICTPWNEPLLIVYENNVKWVAKKQNIDSMFNVLHTKVDLDEPTSLLDHVLLGCTQRQCETGLNFLINYGHL